MALSGAGYDIVPANVACQPVGGLHARNQCSGYWTQGVKRHDIVSTRKRLPINVRSSVGVTGGYVPGASAKPRKRQTAGTMDDRPQRSANTPKYRGRRKGATA